MQKKIKLHPYQELPVAELDAMQQFVQQAIDMVVRELLFDEGRYIRMAVAKTGALEISVGSGYYLRTGVVYEKATNSVHSLAALVPGSNSRIVLVTVTGQEIETETQVRKFLIDAATRQTQPRPVATRIARTAVVDLVAGSASASPARPPVPAGAIVVASLLLGPSGIIGNPAMEAANAVINLELAFAAVKALQEVDAKLNEQLKSITSELAKIKAELKKRALETTTNALVSDVLELRERLGVPDTSSFWGMDVFANEDESDTAFAGYTAKVEAGAMQHGDAEVVTRLAALLNPNDSRVDVTESGFIIPKNTAVAVLTSGADTLDGSISIAQFAVSTIAAKEKKLTQTWRFYGGKIGEAAVAEELAKNPKITVRDPVTGNKVNIDLVGSKFKVTRESKSSSYYEIKVSTPYWDVDEAVVETTGSRVAQTFMCPKDGWYKRIDLDLTEIGPSGDITVQVFRQRDNGNPDTDQLIAQSTRTRDTLAIQGWVEWAFDPFYLEAGERYAFIVTTTGNHWLGTVNSDEAVNGTLLATTDGISWAAQIDKDLRFRLVGTKFAASKVTVELEGLSVTNGMKALSSVITGFIPEGTRLVVEAQVGSAWRLLDDDPTIFNSLPSVVPLRVTFIGTTRLMPGIARQRTRFFASRPLTTSVHVSTPRTLGAGTTTKVTVEENSKDFVEADHDWTVQLLHGAGYATVVNHTSVTTKTNRKDGIITRQWVFDGLPNIAAYRVRTTLGSTTTTNQHSVTQRRDWAA
jgi:hypothetical protein